MTQIIKTLSENMLPDETTMQAACRFLRERDEARAHCERLRELGQALLSEEDDEMAAVCLNRFDDALGETPTQSLREIQAEAVESALERFAILGGASIEQLREHANQLRTGGNDNE